MINICGRAEDCCCDLDSKGLRLQSISLLLCGQTHEWVKPRMPMKSGQTVALYNEKRYIARVLFLYVLWFHSLCRRMCEELWVSNELTMLKRIRPCNSLEQRELSKIPRCAEKTHLQTLNVSKDLNLQCLMSPWGSQSIIVSDVLVKRWSPFVYLKMSITTTDCLIY